LSLLLLLLLLYCLLAFAVSLLLCQAALLVPAWGRQAQEMQTQQTLQQQRHLAQ
jgi:hypothetical protein